MGLSPLIIDRFSKFKNRHQAGSKLYLIIPIGRKYLRLAAASWLKRQLQESDGRVLLILDGLDEYAMGTNIVIDNIVNNRSNATMCKTCLIIASRSEAQNLNLIAKQMNKVILAKGFDEENVIRCANNFFKRAGNEEETSVFLKNDVLELLRIPIILVMAYLLHQEHTEESLPTSKSEVIGEIIDLILDRKKSRKLTEQEKTKIKTQVGEKAWAAAQKYTMVLQKVILYCNCKAL